MVFYYSRAKKTEIFAKTLAQLVGSDFCELKSDINNKGDIGFMIKALSLTFGGKTYPVSDMPVDIPAEIYLCAPIWGGKIAAPACYFLENADIKDTTVNLLLTANVPVEKYKTDAVELLRKTCIPGKTYIFATDDNTIANPGIIKEHLEEALNA